MVNGKLGTLLFIGMMVFMPLEMLTFANMGPGDAFNMAMLISTWVILWRTRARFYFPLGLGMWVILIGSLLGTLSGLDFFSSIVGMIQEVYLYLMFVTLCNNFIERGALRQAVKIWSIVAAIEAVIIILDLFGLVLPIIGGGNAKAAQLGLDSTFGDTGRAVGTFRNANAAGGYMMIAMFAMLAVPFTRKAWVRWGLLILYTLAIFATGSIGAQLGIAAGLTIAVLYWLQRQQRASLFWFGLALLMVAIGLLITPALLPVLSSTEGSTAISLGSITRKLDERLILWYRVPDLMTDHWLGIGPNVTATVAIIGAHSDYVGFFSERGVIGFIGLFMLYGEALFWLGWSLKTGKTWEELLAPGPLLGGLVGLLIMGLVHETFHGRPVWLLYALFFVHYQLIRSALPTQPVEAVAKIQPPQRGWAGRLADEAK